MITANDILRLTYTADLTQGGIAYACRSLPHSYAKAGREAHDRLRPTVAHVAVELALRRYLVEEGIPFDVKGAVPFTDPNHYSVSLHGRRCDIRTFLMTNRRQVLSIRMDPGLMLEAPALVPVDQYAAEGQSPQDLYLFAFLLGTIADSSIDAQRSGHAERPMHLVHLMPGSWAHPRVWIPLGPLALKSEDLETLELEIGGQDRDRETLTRSVVLPPRTRLELADDFHSLTYLHVETRPTGRLAIRSPSRRETQVIEPMEWRNIWINGTEIYLAGWITREQFRQRARLVYEGSRVFQYSRTRTKNLALPISELKPLTKLFERARMKVG